MEQGGLWRNQLACTVWRPMTYPRGIGWSWQLDGSGLQPQGR